MADPATPAVLIVGGFLTEPLFYRSMRERLLERGAASVTIAPVHLADWLAMSFAGMGPLLLRTALAIGRGRRTSLAPLMVVGHSAGGLLARLAMSPLPLDGRVAAIADDVGCLVTLGTPHHLDPGVPRWRHAGVRASQHLERATPGAWFAPRTAYVSVGSRRVLASPLRFSPWPPGFAHVLTRLAVDQPAGAPGDGLVTDEQARLPGARHLSFDDVLHGTFGGPWYGDAHVIERWWPVALAAWRDALAARQDTAGTRMAKTVDGS